MHLFHQPHFCSFRGIFILTLILPLNLNETPFICISSWSSHSQSFRSITLQYVFFHETLLHTYTQFCCLTCLCLFCKCFSVCSSNLLSLCISIFLHWQNMLGVGPRVHFLCPSVSHGETKCCVLYLYNVASVYSACQWEKCLHVCSSILCKMDWNYSYFVFQLIFILNKLKFLVTKREIPCILCRCRLAWMFHIQQHSDLLDWFMCFTKLY